MSIDDYAARVNTDWFDGGWFDVLTMQRNAIKSGLILEGHQCDNQSTGGSIAVPFTLKPGEEKRIIVRFAWYVPHTVLRFGLEEEETECTCCKKQSCGKPTHKPWYSTKYSDVEEAMAYFTKHYEELYEASRLFSESFYQSTLQEVVLDAVSANLTILKSPTVLRQTDGRIWAWEGCCDTNGCCSGSCTHVWNYAQAMCHLFPTLERSLRQTEFNECQNEEGHQDFRAPLPIREVVGHGFHAASDGQLGGIMKLYREWRISGDSTWILEYWDKLKISLDYCIRTWDPGEEGVLKEPHHNTYDIEFWGADSMCSSFLPWGAESSCFNR